jgi:hypothetical protein
MLELQLRRLLTTFEKARLNLVRHVRELGEVGLERGFCALHVRNLPYMDLTYLFT